MKKKISLLLIIALIGTFCIACGSSTAEEPTVDEQIQTVLDDYEKLADQYIDVTQKYGEAVENKDVSAIPDLLKEYTDMSEQYTQCLKDIQAIDYEALEEASQEYYDEVTERVKQRVADTLSEYADQLKGAK